MDFDLTTEQEDFRKVVRQFAEEVEFVGGKLETEAGVEAFSRPVEANELAAARQLVAADPRACGDHWTSAAFTRYGDGGRSSRLDPDSGIAVRRRGY